MPLQTKEGAVMIFNPPPLVLDKLLVLVLDIPAEVVLICKAVASNSFSICLPMNITLEPQSVAFPALLVCWTSQHSVVPEPLALAA